MIIGNMFLNKENNLTKYFRKSAFPIYILHQTILVIVGYYALKMMNNIYLQVSVIIFGSFVITVLLYEIVKRIPVIRKTIGVR